MTSSSYRPGEWFGIFGEQATVVLPPSEKSRAVRIWALVDEGAGFDEVLDALISDGLRGLPGFVLVSEDEGQTKVVIRGAARAEFEAGGQTITVEGSSVTTWQERSLDDVASMRIDVADGEGRPDLAISEGLVRIARIDRPAVESADTGVDDPHPTDDDATPVPSALDETAYYSSTPVPQAEPDAPAAAGNWDLAALAATRSEPAAPADAADAADVPEAEPVAAARLTFSDGQMVDVDQVVLIGRGPDPSRVPDAPQPPRVVTVVSPNQEISSTHLEIRPGSGDDQGVAVVTDLGSTNGTVLQRPGLSREDLRPGVPVSLPPGAVIDLGDGVTILVESA
jgi:hypothetical protein